jgi:hypothetical protein
MKATMPKPFALVLMPYRDEFKDVYEIGIKEACEKVGVYCERIDEQIYEGTILDRIYNQIAKADIIISEMSDRNPNVFYETGYAHALGKQVIIVTRKAEEIPFDLMNYPHVVYEGRLALLRAELEKRLRWFVENPASSLARVEFTMQLFISGEQLQADSPTRVTLSYVQGYEVGIQAQSLGRFGVDVYNPTPKIFDGERFRVGLITERGIARSYKSTNIIQLPDQRRLHMFEQIGTVLPSCWDSLQIYLDAYQGPVHTDMTVRVFTELGTLDYPVTV